MADFGLLPYEKYRDKSGLFNIEKLLSDPGVFVSHHLHDGVKRLEVINLPNGMVYYAKPVGDYREASAEKILSKMYQLQGFISPETTIGHIGGKLYAMTNDVLPLHNTERGYIFLKKLCPGGEQYVLPSIYKFGEESRYYKAFSKQLLRDQIPHYHGLALATKNWDSNYCNMNFRFHNKVHEKAIGLVSIDYGKSLDEGLGFIELKYVSPFSERRASPLEFYQQFVEASRNTNLVNLNDISHTIYSGLETVDEIVRSAKEEGAPIDDDYVETLKASMDNTARTFERE